MSVAVKLGIWRRLEDAFAPDFRFYLNVIILLLFPFIFIVAVRLRELHLLAISLPHSTDDDVFSGKVDFGIFHFTRTST